MGNLCSLGSAVGRNPAHHGRLISIFARASSSRVEFQNNFYLGSGQAFAPFSFKAMFAALEAEEME